MNTVKTSRLIRLLPSLVLGIAPAVAFSQAPIAGLEPSVRPAGAPRIESVTKDESWYRNALTGVLAPYPRSLRFLEAQGNWDTPFNHPGMTGRYDIRGWHRNAGATQEKGETSE